MLTSDDYNLDEKYNLKLMRIYISFHALDYYSIFSANIGFDCELYYINI